MDWLLQYTHPSVDWNFAIVTLIIRFIGVFIVLFFIQIALQLASKCVRYIEKREMNSRAASLASTQQAVVDKSKVRQNTGLDDATVAAIALALEIETRASRSRSSGSGHSVAWSIAGRMNQVRFR